MGFFDAVPLAPADPILGLTAAYHAETRKTKVNLGVGVYRDEALHTPILSSVKLAESFLLSHETSKEYLPIEGQRDFIDQTGKLIFGEAFWKREFSRVCGFQAIGGTGALRIGGAFLKQEVDAPVFIPHPTWPNHRGLFQGLGYQVSDYPYYAINEHVLQFEQMLAFLQTIPPKSIVLLHASCHNPTGNDLTLDQWAEIRDVCMKRQLLPFFDCAYQGLGKGIEEDVQSIRLFAESGLEMLVASSHSKNFSLYGERTGGLFIVTASALTAQKVMSRVKQIIRIHYSNPPIHGARIVSHILSHEELFLRWKQELNQMNQRIVNMRKQLIERLKSLNGIDRFPYLSKGVGMFCYSGLQKEQVERIVREFGIYMPSDGRINVCGLNADNLDYVAQAMIRVT